MKTSCETCGKELRLAPSQVGRKRFCSRDCQWSGHRPVTLACEHCGKSYEKAKACEERSRFCSRQCHCTHLAQKQTASALIDRACPACGRVFQTTQHHGGKKTCSPECAKRRQGESNLGRDARIDILCAQCGQVFRVLPSRERPYCSHTCAERASVGRIVASALTTCHHCGKSIRRPNSRLARCGRQFCRKACYHEWDRLHKNTPEMREKTAARIRDGSFGKSSGTETLVADWLKANGLPHEPQHTLRPFYTVDFRVGETMVEVNGCYWHGCPEHFPELTPQQRKRRGRDAALVTFCARRGIPLLVIWEHDIRRGDFSALTPLLTPANSLPPLTGSTSGSG